MLAPPVTAGIVNVVAALVSLVLLRKPIQYPDRPASKWFALVIASGALWLIVLGLAYLIAWAPLRNAAWSVRFFAASLLSVGWFLLALRITTHRWPTRRLVVALTAYLALGAIVLSTNVLHGLAFDPSAVHGTFPAPTSGPWRWFQVIVNFSLLLVAMALAAVVAIRSEGLRRTQSTALALAPLLPGAANLVSVLGVAPPGPDVTPLGFVGGAFVLSWAVYRAEFLAIVPVGRQRAVEDMHDPVVTIDANYRVVDCNAAARELFGSDEAYFGEPLATLLPGVPDRALAALERGHDPQFRLRTDDEVRYVECATSAVGPSPDRAAGRVVVLRDITDRTERERRLLEQRDALEELAGAVVRDVQDPLETARDGAERAIATGDVSHMNDVLDAASHIDRRTRALLERTRQRQSAEGADYRRDSSSAGASPSPSRSASRERSRR